MRILMWLACPWRFRPKDVRERSETPSPPVPPQGQSMQVYLREVLEREYRADRNARLFDQLVSHRSLALDAGEIVEYIRAGREDD
jgi:hypothetical protein